MHHEEEEELLCCICVDYPPKEVYQCPEGHVYCKTCYDGMIMVKPTCAICRIIIVSPSRNRIAESRLQKILIPCPNEWKGCQDKYIRAKLKEHENNECLYRICSCGAFGCSWTGIIKKKVLEEETKKLKIELSEVKACFANEKERMREHLMKVKHFSLMQQDLIVFKTSDQDISNKTLCQSQTKSALTKEFEKLLSNIKKNQYKDAGSMWFEWNLMVLKITDNIQGSIQDKKAAVADINVRLSEALGLIEKQQMVQKSKEIENLNKELKRYEKNMLDQVKQILQIKYDLDKKEKMMKDLQRENEALKLTTANKRNTIAIIDNFKSKIQERQADNQEDSEEHITSEDSEEHSALEDEKCSRKIQKMPFEEAIEKENINRLKALLLRSCIELPTNKISKDDWINLCLANREKVKPHYDSQDY